MEMGLGKDEAACIHRTIMQYIGPYIQRSQKISSAVGYCKEN